MKLYAAVLAFFFLTTTDAFLSQTKSTRSKHPCQEPDNTLNGPNPRGASQVFPSLKLHQSLTPNVELSQLISSNPLSLSLLAGLSTCVGAAVVFFLNGDDNGRKAKTTAAARATLSDAQLSASLSLAGSVMLTVTLYSLLPESLSDSSTLIGGLPVIVERALFVMLGWAAYAALERWVLPEDPESIIGSESHAIPMQNTSDPDPTQTAAQRSFASGSDLHTEDALRSWRVTLVLFWSLAIHNFPEGLAVAASAVHSPQLGITTAVAIALHNIPEGIAIAVPCLAARPDEPWLAFGLASLSGLAEPLGAALTLSLLNQQHYDVLQALPDVLAFVAGIMATVACLELFPEALKHSKNGYGPFSVGLVSGSLVMIGTETVLSG